MPARALVHMNELLGRRAGVRIAAEWGHVSVLLGGGHICDFVSNTHPDVNPLWQPPWPTVDPDQYKVHVNSARFGSPPDGPLLAGIAGHSLSFDHFGPPSPEETAAGRSTHGEASASLWKVYRQFENEYVGLEYGVVLPVSDIDFRRTLCADPKYPVLYIEEKAINLSASDRPISWNEHVTVGPPFLRCNDTVVDIPAERSQVIDSSYSDAMVVMPNSCFEWPHAPAQSGGSHDLRQTPEGDYCRYTAQLLNRSLEFGFISVATPSIGLLLLYVFRRTDFPWVGNWEERFYHKNLPWAGKTFCRGVEFSSTPFAIPKRETISRGPLFEETTYRWLSAHSQINVRFLALLVEIPQDFLGIARISVGNNTVRIEEHETSRSITQTVDTSFLSGESINS